MLIAEILEMDCTDFRDVKDLEEGESIKGEVLLRVNGKRIWVDIHLSRLPLNIPENAGIFLIGENFTKERIESEAGVEVEHYAFFEGEVLRFYRKFQKDHDLQFPISIPYPTIP